jgi:hypothetical protein
VRSGTKDGHLRDAIAGMKELKALFISVHDPKDTRQANEAVVAIETRREELGFDELEDIYFFPSESAHIWG